MTHSLNMIYETYPNVQVRMENPSSISEMNNIESIFYQLALFINEPKKSHLNLSDVYNSLDNYDLMNFLDILQTFYKRDTNKLNNIDAYVKDEAAIQKGFDPGDYYKQRTFCDMVVSEVPHTTLTPKYFWGYVERGKVVPPADLAIDGQKFWHKSTVKRFIETEKKTKKRKKIL